MPDHGRIATLSHDQPVGCCPGEAVQPGVSVRRRPEVEDRVMRRRPRSRLVLAPRRPGTDERRQFRVTAKDLHLLGQSGGQRPTYPRTTPGFGPACGHQLLSTQYQPLELVRSPRWLRARKAGIREQPLGSRGRASCCEVDGLAMRFDDELPIVPRTDRPDGIDAAGAEQHLGQRMVPVLTQMPPTSSRAPRSRPSARAWPRRSPPSAHRAQTRSPPGRSRTSHLPTTAAGSSPFRLPARHRPLKALFRNPH